MVTDDPRKDAEAELYHGLGDADEVGTSTAGGDGTERRRTAQALAESDPRFRYALDAGGVGTWDLDLERERSFVDEKLCELSGLPGDLREVDLSCWLECVHPEDRRRVRREVETAVAERRDYASEFRVVLPDGTVRWLAGRGGVVGDGASSARMVGVSFDITAAKRVEQRRSALDAVTEILANAEAWEDAAARVLEALGTHLRLDVCEIWTRDPVRDLLSCSRAHCAAGLESPAGFTPGGGGAVFARGEGLPGKVLAAGTPLWRSPDGDDRADPAEETRSWPFPTAFGFPVVAAGEVSAVVTCFAAGGHPEDAALLEMLGGLGGQLGELRRRSETENAQEASDARSRETLVQLDDEPERRVVSSDDALQRRTALRQRLSNQLTRSERDERKRVARALQDHVQQLIAAASRGLHRAVAFRAPTHGAVRVLVVDDHRIVREGLASMLSRQANIDVVGEAEDGDEALDLATAIEPDVVLMDVDLPGISGIEATRLIKRRLPHVHVIGLSIHEERDVAESMKSAGASDFLTKGGHPECLFRCVLEVAGGGR